MGNIASKAKALADRLRKLGRLQRDPEAYCIEKLSIEQELRQMGRDAEFPLASSFAENGTSRRPYHQRSKAGETT